MRIESNAVQVAELLAQGSSALPRASHAAGDAVGDLIGLETTKAMEELIYEQPLPPSYGWFGLSDRTGALLAAETVVQLSPGERVITTENTGLAGKNPEIYAEERHANAKYPAPWRDVGLSNARDSIEPTGDKALTDAMPDGLVTP